MTQSPSVPTGATPAFTARDVALLRCLDGGASTAQMAVALSITSNTVRTRVRRIQAKLGVSTRSQMVQAARALDLL
jgi:DNA-binding CsgD family transcriptional regulator